MRRTINRPNPVIARVIVVSLVTIIAGILSAQSSRKSTRDQMSLRPNEPHFETFEYETVQIDSNGSVTHKEKERARYFSEELGDGVKIDLVFIPGGHFSMGSPEGEKGRQPDEGPQHSVHVPEFFMGKYEVTVKQWNAVAKLPKVRFKDMAILSYGHNNQVPYSYYDHPEKFYDCAINMISWEYAKEFCDRLSRRTGRKYRLPSEAEWEYACRANTVTPFSFGETITPELANYDTRYHYGGDFPNSGKCVCTSMPVGLSGFANGFGLYDMHGNVWEWCLDQYRENYWGAPKDGTPWFNNEDKKGRNLNLRRVLRGGGYNSSANACRSASRWGGGSTPGISASGWGFRIVMEPAK